MSETRPRQTSLPPPYQANSNQDASDMPYLDSTSPTAQESYYSTLPYYTSLPAFDAPPNYSRRLRRLIESRRRPTHLSLVIPAEKAKIIEQIFFDESSSSSSSSSSYDADIEKSTNLLGDMSCEDLDPYSTHRQRQRSRSRSRTQINAQYRRRSSISDDREISWTAFAGMASVLFMVLCSCSIFVAWSTGLFQGTHGLHMMQAQMHGMEGVSSVWITEAASGMVLDGGSSDVTSVVKATSTSTATADSSTVAVEVEVAEPMSRREVIQRRAERSRRSARRTTTKA